MEIDFEKYRYKMFGLAYRLTKNVEDAQDLVQEAMLKASIKQVDRRKVRNMQSYLMSIVYTIYVDQKRLIRPLVHQMNDVVANKLLDPCPSVLDTLVNETLSPELTWLLEQLDKKDRQILLWRAEGLSYYEIAEELSTTIAATKLRLFRAREKAKVFWC